MKGFVFSLDVWVGVIIALVILAASFYSLSSSQEDIWPQVQLEKQAKDILLVLDKTNSLESLNKTRIKENLDKGVPSNVGARIDIVLYKCTPYPCVSDSTIKFDSYNLTYSTSQIIPSDIVTAKKTFLVFDGGIKYFSIAQLGVWYK